MKKQTLTKVRFEAILILIAAIGLIVIALFLFFSITQNYDVAKAGQWGDFFGGSLNPVFSFLTFLAVLLTLVLQKTELALTREELKRSGDTMETQAKTAKQQTFEHTFFQMLNLHNTMLNSTGINDYKGRELFRYFYFDSSYGSTLSYIYKKLKRETTNTTEIDLIKTAYDMYWQKAESFLAHYYRYLFNIIKFVDESDFASGPYMNILRAQLSNSESLLLFYNGLSPQGEKFRAYIEKYSLLNNMPISKLLDNSHTSFYSGVVYS